MSDLLARALRVYDASYPPSVLNGDMPIPTLRSVTPTSGPPGTPLTFLGSNLNGTWVFYRAAGVPTTNLADWEPTSNTQATATAPDVTAGTLLHFDVHNHAHSRYLDEAFTVTAAAGPASATMPPEPDVPPDEPEPEPEPEPDEA